MSSSIPVETIEDDDEFDWEAAVSEIDVACQSNANPSTSYCPPPFSTSALNQTSNCVNSNNSKKPAACKQSTLDGFITRANPNPRSQPGNPTVEEAPQEHFEAQDGVSSVDIDTEAAKTWIYPVNVPLRDYQLAITKTALFSNTLVALPTGLGKTLIAAVVMYNYYRWFPEGKIVFAAPSRPLVMQQIEACHNIVGIPQEWTIDLTGQTSPTKRAFLWKNKRVFFVTPQVLEKDIQSGTCLVKYMVCLVIDEAHRATGNYSSCVAVRELMAMPVRMRILALTATPGSKAQAIQYVIDNLHISMLEYRSESDPDVSPYVHNRKVELIEVALGKDAHNINCRLLEVIRPYAFRLSSIGLLQNRDYQTLSPCDLLLSRDKFRQAPPLDLPHIKHADVESCFAALITLYHIRKLLSSHGIRPAYEMLEEKLQQGSFARLMSKNEDIRKAKLLMQQSLSHGAPSPKLSKMLEVLVDHFKTKDPQTSRVIIFSNFRGSVRDIMRALANIGDLVKATEFIGQSSGKTLKGQSQKVQQAVLEKFRAGGYNVIVATSIGEEGLDIMEVDLVICFDANVSPLRMIQRMGRTGRKNDGRVVVLACEGSELKGYMRKQASSRSVNKHMRNGGINSFNFHPSPRMVPHIYKPEAQFVEMSIEQFIPRGKKLKDDHPVQTPLFKSKLEDAETDLIAKYFGTSVENSWRPSLIAFPHFQSIPSKVHKVMHSKRTVMFIDAMQYLQEVTFSEDPRSSSAEDKAPSGHHVKADTAEPLNYYAKDDIDIQICEASPTSYDVPVSKSERDKTDYKASQIETLSTMGTNDIADFHLEDPPAHSYHFGSDFVSVDDFGKVFIMSVPVLPFNALQFKCINVTGKVYLDYRKEISDELLSGSLMQAKEATGLTLSESTCLRDGTLFSRSELEMFDGQQEKVQGVAEEVPKTPILQKDAMDAEVPSDENDIGYPELSPRLTNFITSGVVPESPISDPVIMKIGGMDEVVIVNLCSPVKSNCELLSKSLSPEKIEQNVGDHSCGRNALISSISDRSETPGQWMSNAGKRNDLTSPVPEECQSPLVDSTNYSGSKDWRLSSGEIESVEQARKLKRLRKVGDCAWNGRPKTLKENCGMPLEIIAGSSSGIRPKRKKLTRGKRRLGDDVLHFIDEEAEVSLEAEISIDEEDGHGNDSYDDSFIDDRKDPTASSQDDSSRVDMMAIYRRSLLSQIPGETGLDDNHTPSPSCVPPMTRIDESESSSCKSLYSLRSPLAESIRNSKSPLRNQYKTSSQARQSTTAVFSRESAVKIESRKRKLSFCESTYLAPINLEQEFSRQSGADGINGSDVFDDEKFYEALDFDALEAQATLLLNQNSDLTMQKQEVLLPQSNLQNIVHEKSPSFDLGFG